MSILLVAIITTAGILLGKFLFKKWFNHLTLYSLIMGGLIFLYELKLLPYYDIIPFAWYLIIISFLAFLFGIITVISGRNLFNKIPLFTSKQDISLSVFSDDGKALKYSVLLFSIVSLFVAIQRWIVLINMFGSIQAVLVNAGIVYRLNVNREIKDFIPILPAFVYIAIFLSGIYTAYRGKFSFLSFFPFIGIIIKELTYFGRAELLLCLIEFIFSFLLFRNLLNNDIKTRFKFSRKNAVFATILLFMLLISAASFIRLTRGNYENYMGASRQLKQMKENLILSPSVYLYLSSDIGVFNKYIEAGGEDARFGQNTFSIVYTFLSRLDITPEPPAFQKGYHIPMWTNTGTYLRELHADFGVAGVYFGPYLIGLILTWLWFKFYETKNLIVFAFLVYLSLIVGFSFLVMVTRLNQWYLSLFLIICYLPLLERFATRNSKIYTEEKIIEGN
ncbi:MAG: oligosaccharide repeat unit polymerase [Ignavibacteriales bacterium]|nr:MAG: oligosaccharide repeat unit polymerase [Ignavibacteriales bacterium]